MSERGADEDGPMPSTYPSICELVKSEPHRVSRRPIGLSQTGVV